MVKEANSLYVPKGAFKLYTLLGWLLLSEITKITLGFKALTIFLEIFRHFCVTT